MQILCLAGRHAAFKQVIYIGFAMYVGFILVVVIL